MSHRWFLGIEIAGDRDAANAAAVHLGEIVADAKLMFEVANPDAAVSFELTAVLTAEEVDQ